MSSNTISLKVNGVEHSVSSDVAVTQKLITFLRDTLGLTGTRFMCSEGGCGVCTVVATAPDPTTGGSTTFSINSCLASLYNCDGWEITTIEGLGNQEDGYHVIQERLAEYYGTQCGFCSPGMVMNMHGLTQSNPSWTTEDVEKNLDGHICRCTGYRPILSAFKSITPTDIEDAHKTMCSKKKAEGCCKGGKQMKTGGCCKQTKALKKEITVDGVTWYSPSTTQEMLDIMAALPLDTTFQFVFGNTGGAVLKMPAAQAMISTRNIAELSSVTITASLVSAGCGVSISTLKAAFKTAQQQPGFEYLAQIDDHWQHLASTSVRNLGGWAGNVAVKVMNPSFPSDIFLTLVGCGAEILVGKTDGSTTWYSAEQLLSMDFQGNREVMLRLRFLPLSAETYFRSYKVIPRSTNTLAYVGGSFSIMCTGNTIVSGTPTIAFSSINPSFNRATETENYLIGKDLSDESVLQTALATLDSELVPQPGPADPDAEYKSNVAKGLLYRVFLDILNSAALLDSSLVSGSKAIVRPVSSGTQSWQVDTSMYPLGEPIPKVESKQQCAGEIKYVNDTAPLTNELFGYPVQSTKANAAIDNIDPSAALAVDGVVGFVSASDIQGTNDLRPILDIYEERVFAQDRVQYHGQAVGLIVATTQEAAKEGAALVSVTYSDEKVPILTIEEAMAGGFPPGQSPPYVVGDVSAGFATSTKIVEGAMHRGSQSHFHMETQSVRVVPSEGLYDIEGTSQWPSHAQFAVAHVLGVKSNKVKFTVKRLGGGFGGKINNGNLIFGAAAVAAQKFRQPVRINLDLKTNMSLMGWRDVYYFTYKVGVDDAGVLQAVQATTIADSGYTSIDSSAIGAAYIMPNCYECANWEVTPRMIHTDTANNTWCRSPGSIEGIAIMEYVMDHLAYELNMDPLELRKLNLIPDDSTRLASTIPIRIQQTLALNGQLKDGGLRPFNIQRNLISDMITQIEQEANVAARKAEIAQYNQDNRWRKRGLAVMPMLWPYDVPNAYGIGAFIAVYGLDGGVVLSLGGIEMGQGLNTKVAQIVAYTLGCSMDKIQVRATNTVVGANSEVTGGALGTDVTSYSAQQAAIALRARLDTIAQEGDTWEDTVRRAFVQGHSLCEYYWNGPSEVNSYSVFGVACAEVELDILTGNFLVRQTNIIEDAGKTSNPLIDIGQVEGAFVFGQGLFTTEAVKYDKSTGEKLTVGTFDYKPPLCLDIPTDLRVSLLENAPNPLGVALTKVTNEPPTCLAFVIPMALREAIASARIDAGNSDWFQMDYPLSVDKIHELCLVDHSQFVYTPLKKDAKKKKNVQWK